MIDIDPKLLKVVALAKGGIGGEKDAAIAMVKRICDREGLDFDEVMDDHDKPKEYTPEIKVRNREELQIAIQVAAKFATTKEHPQVRGRYYGYDRTIILWYTCTPAQHIDTLNAVNVYLKAFRKERTNFLRSLQTAFYSHHNLFSQFKDDDGDDEPPKEKTLQERQDTWRAVQMMQAMTESVNITKEIGDGK